MQRKRADDAFIKTVAEELRKAMERKGFTNTTLAEAMGCKPQQVTQLIRGTHNMTLKTLVRVATAMGLRVRFTFKPKGVEE